MGVDDTAGVDDAFTSDVGAGIGEAICGLLITAWLVVCRAL